MAVPALRVARVDRRDLHDVPAEWTVRERGQYLRFLLTGKGIDPDRLFRVEYHPRRHCWVLTQEEPISVQNISASATVNKDDERLYVATITIFRRVAQSAFAALAVQDRHFASCGQAYKLPAQPQETTTAELVQQLGGSAAVSESVAFTSEGGWHTRPSNN